MILKVIDFKEDLGLGIISLFYCANGVLKTISWANTRV